MSHFVKRLLSDQGNLSFYFNRIFTAEGTRYHISAVDRNRRPLSFAMEEKNGTWWFVNTDNCPSWLIKLEKKLSDAILLYSQ
jgi:hypothetical protein